MKTLNMGALVALAALAADGRKGPRIDLPMPPAEPSIGVTRARKPSVYIGEVVCVHCGFGGGTLFNADGDKKTKIHRDCKDPFTNTRKSPT